MLLFIHIPKTAGTSIYAALRQLVPETLAWFDGPMNAPQNFFARPDVRQLTSVYGGHFGYQHIRPFLTSEDRIYSVVREPVERAFSYYNHIVKRDRQHPLHRQIKNLSIIDAAKSCNIFSRDIKNMQCWFLSGSKNFEETKRVLIAQNINVYLMSQLDLMIGEMAAELEIDDPPRVGTANAAEDDYAGLITTEEREFMIRTNDEDRKLYWYLRDLNADKIP